MGSWEIVYLGLGSNLGNRIKKLIQAKCLLEKDPKVQVGEVSSIYETSPIGPKQNDFLNCVFKIKTLYSPLELLRVVKGIENNMKRKKTFRDGPRVIDIDILFYGKKVVRTEELTIPHPRFAERKFVLEPLAEIAANLRPPRSSKTIRQFQSQLTSPDQRVKLYGKLGN